MFAPILSASSAMVPELERFKSGVSPLNFYHSNGLQGWEFSRRTEQWDEYIIADLSYETYVVRLCYHVAVRSKESIRLLSVLPNVMKWFEVGPKDPEIEEFEHKIE